MSALSTLRSRGVVVPATVDDVFDRPGPMRPMALLRVVLGPIVVVHLWDDVTAAWDGVSYLDRFWEPWFTFAPEVPAWGQYALVHVGVIAAVAMCVGWHTRWTAPLTATCVTANLFLSQTHFRHNRAFLVFLLWAVACSASGRELAVRPDPGPRWASWWPTWTMRALASSVYFASGFSKLIDPDWLGGLVLWDRSVRYAHEVTDAVPGAVGEWVVDVITTRWVHSVTSPIAVAMELFIAVGLWFARTRMAAVWVAVFFHLSIEVSASVEIFSLAAVVALVIWTTPVERDRVVTTDERWVRRLDWLARFDVRPGTGAFTLVDHDGTVHTGSDARWRTAARLPLTFVVAAPVVMVTTSLRRRTDSSVP